MNADEQPELLKTIEAARMLGVTRSTVLSYAYRGILDYVTTPGGQRRFYRDQVEALRAAGEGREQVDQSSLPESEPDS
jgi:excisionase family DNA binding protein